jgi:2-polyprenyl-3-methyl-5-hydroxy-6-metoxy-1,4-benzoquinol methylase
MTKITDKKLNKSAYGFWEIGDKPSRKDLELYYSEKYYQEGKGGAIEYTSDELLQLKNKLDEIWHVIENNTPNLGNLKSFLDVGCGEGNALAFFASKGFVVTGLDYSSAGVQSKNPGYIDNLIAGDIYTSLEKQIFLQKKYDVIMLQNVLEHVLDPINLMLNLKKLITPKGLICISVPNDFSITQMAAISHGHIQSAFWVSPPDHLNYFNSESLLEVASVTGYDFLDMIANFPIDFFLFNTASNYVIDSSKGKAAHNARIQIENVISKQPIEEVIQLYRSFAKIGLGRNLTIFLRPHTSN